MKRKLTRKEKVKLQEKQIPPIIITQRKFFIRINYLLIIMGLTLGIGLLLTYELPDVEIDATFIIISILIGFFFGWIFFLLPANFILNPKVITIKNKEFKIESKRKKYSINTSFDKLISWRKLYHTHGTDFYLKFESKEISLSESEFGLYQLEQLLRQKYANKERK